MARTTPPGEIQNPCAPCIIAIDPGTKCGWCVRGNTTTDIVSGVWNLKGGRFEGGGMRFLRFRHYLEETIRCSRPAMIVYEEVRRHMGTDAAHIYGGIVGQLTSICEEQRIPYRAIPVGTIKKYATGKGNAGKTAMIEAAQKQWPGFMPLDDNEADARWIAECAAADGIVL